MEANLPMCYVYIQPLQISTSHCKGGRAFQGQNSLQVDAPKAQSSTEMRSSIKVRDLIKFNKEYKVYNKNIHFYNFIYSVELKGSIPSETAQSTIKIRLLTKGPKKQPRVRSYLLPLSTIFENESAGELKVWTKVLDENGIDQSQLACNIVKSKSSISLRVLEEILEEKNNFVLRTYSKIDQSDSSFSITMMPVEKKQQLDTVESNSDYDEILKEESCIKGTYDSSVNNSMVSGLSKEERVTDAGSQFWKGESPVRRQTCDSNTMFLDESPRMKKVLRLRRSLIRACSMESTWSEEEIAAQQVVKEKKKWSKYLSHFILLMGVCVIFLLMKPSNRL